MKNKVLYVIIGMLLVVIGVLGFFLLKDKITDKKEDNTSNESTKNKVDSSYLSVATKNDKNIVLLTNDGKEKNLLNIADYTSATYTINNNKLYLILFTSGATKDSHKLGYIDLTDENYKYVELNDNAEGLGVPESIAVIDKDIYYTTMSNGAVYIYNMDSKNTTQKKNFANNDGKYPPNVYNVGNDKLVNMLYGSVNTISKFDIIDVKTDSITRVGDDVSVEYVYGDKVIYLKYTPKTNSSWTYYEYDTKNNKSVAISDVAEGGLSTYDAYIVPYDDGYLYVNKDTIYKYKDGKKEKFYTANDWIQELVLVSNNTLHIQYGMGMDDDGVSAKLNLSDMSLVEDTQLVMYTNVVYIK